MSFFTKTKKPSYDLIIRYDNIDKLHYFKLNIKDQGDACANFNFIKNFNEISSNKINNDDINEKKTCSFSGATDQNPVSAFWNYNSASFPSFVFE